MIIYADFIDPFCYIGFHNLRTAAEPLKVVLEWRGFELNPDTPPEGYFLQTAGNSDLRPGMWASVKEYAARAGLSFPEPQRVPNTRLAHGLVRNAKNPLVKNPLIERIYQAYFNENRDIGSPAVLVDLAKEFGMDENAVAQAADLERYREEAKARQFPGMPGFLYRGKPYFGALPQTSWQSIFDPKKTPKESLCSTR